MICCHVTGIRNKKFLHLKITPEFLHRADSLKLCFGFSHLARPQTFNRKFKKHVNAIRTSLQWWVYASRFIPHLSQFRNMLTDTASLYPHSNLRDGGVAFTRSFNVTTWGVGEHLQRTAKLLVPGPGLEAGARTQGSWLPAQNTSHWIMLSIGWRKLQPHSSGWRFDSYLNTQLQASSYMKILHVILIGKLPNRVKGAREAWKRSESRVFHTAGDVATARTHSVHTGIAPPFTSIQWAPCTHRRRDAQ